MIRRGCKATLIRDYPRGDSISDKFANLSEDVTWVKSAGGWL